MPRIYAFDGYLIKAASAAEVVAPAYDAASAHTRREFIDANPKNYLGCTRLSEDFPESKQPTTDELFQINRAKLIEILNSGAYQKIDQPSIYIYRLSQKGHSQIGVVCEIPVEDYQNGNLRKHENTRSDKEDLLADYQKVVGVSSSPICIAHPPHAGVDKFLNAYTATDPDLDFISQDGVAQQIWRVVDAAQLNVAQKLFAEIETTYLTDGHHRAAASCRYAQMCKNKKDHGNQPYDQLLVAMFAADQLNLLPFHRVVRDLNGLSGEQLLTALRADFSVTENAGDNFAPSAHGEFGILINRRWHKLQIKPNLINAHDPVASLDVSILQDHILQPILGINDVRTDARLDYVAGDCSDVYKKCADGWALGIATYPTAMHQLFAVADADKLMPPKSTFFEPKTRAGIFIRPYKVIGEV